MPPLQLVLSEGFDQESAQTLAAVLQPIIETGTPDIIRRKASGDGALPQFIHAVAPWQVWHDALDASAASFINRLSLRSADIAWDEAEHLLAWPDMIPLASVAAAFAQAKESLDQGSSLVIGLNIPSERFGTVVMIEDGRPVKIAYCIARFVIRAERISRAIHRVMATGEALPGPALLSFADDGSVKIVWNSQSDRRGHEIYLAP